MNTHTFTLATLGFVAGIMLLAIFFERILILAGLTRGNTIGLAIATIILIALQQIMIPKGFNLAFGLFIVILGPIGANRYDITRTFYKGRWWWLSKSDSKDS